MLRLTVFFLCFVVVLDSRGLFVDCHDSSQSQCDQSCHYPLYPLLSYVPDLRTQIDYIENAQQFILIKQDALLLNIQRDLKELSYNIKQDHQDACKDSITKKDFETFQARMNDQFQAILKKMDGIQAKCSECPAIDDTISTNKAIKIPPHFEQIGSRFFYIENKTKRSWTDAEITCRGKGGYMAAIKNKDEFNDISAKLKKGDNYWLGINDLVKEGTYKSIASGKEAIFLQWARNNPYTGGRKDYVLIRNGYMYNDFGYRELYFICQADSEI
ncbi:uncharacterized protein LOC128260385 [Drosophila gunungcola]|uniref:uncharacterized protein LOC128260385 n=1 Tax=Drosophila gunungcola TaxID=103775 RepID=UPI0022E74950|nr:uncharacterized protein LOC128260385 [Drosophila gunungcola]